MSMNRMWLLLAAVSGLIAVAAGAFGAHALADLPERYLNAFKTGAQYQMYHVLALLAVALAPASRAAAGAAICFLAGTVLFSGSLYALALTQMGVFGAITPVGGVLFIAGWAALAASALSRAGRAG
jgi:uncharacterized membrane protein YgdD (TMEM256/DUF423 family)